MIKLESSIHHNRIPKDWAARLVCAWREDDALRHDPTAEHLQDAIVRLRGTIYECAEVFTTDPDLADEGVLPRRGRVPALGVARPCVARARAPRYPDLVQEDFVAGRPRSRSRSRAQRRNVKPPLWKTGLMVRKNRDARRRNGYVPGGGVNELLLFIENDADLMAPIDRYGVPTQGESIRRNLARKKLQGKYSKDKAAKAWLCLVDSGARKYAWDNYDRPRAQHWHSQRMPSYFPKKTRMAVARHLADYWDREMKLMGKGALADAAGLAASSKYRKNFGGHR